jgi:serine/threonine protein kinase
MTLEVGQIVDHYRLDALIARGKVTSVFSAFDLRLQRPVVFKVLGEEVAADAAFRERFARESTTAAQLGEHPHIVTVFDSNAVDDSLYFVTQFIEGLSLHDLIRLQPSGRGLDPTAALRFLHQVGSALDYAHRHGAVHRDVEPANIMIKTSEEPPGAYLIDFGITKRLVVAPGEAAHRKFPGIAGYASAEKINVVTDVERRADVAALARTVFEALTGAQPFPASADGAPPSSATSAVALQPDLPPALDGVFARALSAHEHERFARCADLVAALTAAFPAAAPSGPSPTPSEAALPAPAFVDRDEEDVARSWRRRTSVAASVGALVLLSALGGWLMWGGSTQAHGSVGAAPAQAKVSPVATTAPSKVSPAATATTSFTPAPSTGPPSTGPPSTGPPTSGSPPSTEPATTGAPPSGSPATAPRARAPSANNVPLATVSPDITSVTPSTVLGPFGNVVGQPVTQATNSQAAVALGLQARQLPGAIADTGTPTYYYAEWLRLTGGRPTTPVVASANGFVIDANGPADLNTFVLGADGRVDTMTECAVLAPCQPLSASVRLSLECQPGPDCAVFASDDEQMVAVLRATVNLRSPITTLIFEISSLNPVVGITDATSTARFDGETHHFSLTLPAGPPPGTETVVTVSFLDGSTSKLTVTYGA